MTTGRKPRRATREQSPAYQWYPKDALSSRSILGMSNEVEGIYRRLLDHAWLEHGLPADLDDIRPLCRVKSRRHFDRIWAIISPLFPQGPDGKRRNRRQERERKKQRKNSRVRQLAARARWNTSHAKSNAHALQMDSFAFAIATPDRTDQDPRVPRPRPLKMVLPHNLRRHLLAAVHSMIEAGPPYVTADGLQIAEITDELKTVATKLGVSWSHTRDLDKVVNEAVAVRERRAAGGRRA